MAPRGSGSIVVVGSMTGKRPLGGRAAYATSKAALVDLVSPGPVAGDRLDRVLDVMAQSTGTTGGEALAELTEDSPSAAVVSPEQVAAAVCFLASDEAGAVTGAGLNVSVGAAMC